MTDTYSKYGYNRAFTSMLDLRMQHSPLYQQVAAELQTLEALLKDNHLWASTEPSAEAMASTAPFACDTLPFEQWLQFVLIPGLTHLVEHGLPLPQKMAVLPMAEEVFGDDVRSIVASIGRLDAMIDPAGA